MTSYRRLTCPATGNLWKRYLFGIACVLISIWIRDLSLLKYGVNLMAIKSVERLLSQKEVVEKLNIHRSTFVRIRFEEGFPKAVKVGKRFRWRQSDIDRWIDENIQ